jgi:hypothetical protein
MDPLSGFNAANDLAKQLITLSTGILALSITFTKDLLKGGGHLVKWPLVTAWFMYFCSIVFGIWELMAITGSIFEAVSSQTPNTMYGANIKIPSILQIVSFLLATIFLIIYGGKALRTKSNGSVVSPAELGPNEGD